MRNEISIQGVSPVGAPGDLPPEPRAPPAIIPASAVPVTESPMHPNPSQRLDAALGLVVIEFRDAAGNVTASIPTERQLQAYRLHGRASGAAATAASAASTPTPAAGAAGADPPGQHSGVALAASVSDANPVGGTAPKP